MRHKGHQYRGGICAHTEEGDKVQWAQELPPSTNHLPALLYFQDAMGGLLPIQPRLRVSTKLSQTWISSTYLCPQLLACVETLQSPVDHQQDTPSRMCCALPLCANRALNPQLAWLPKPDWTYSVQKEPWMDRKGLILGSSLPGDALVSSLKALPGFLYSFPPYFAKKVCFYKMKGKQKCY